MMGGKLRVLVVDDDEVTRELLRRVNDYFGLETLEAKDGDEGWKVYQQAEPDLIVSDIHMPRMNGLQLLSSVKKHNANAKVILITGYPTYRETVRSSSRPPDGFLEKPFGIDELRRLMIALT
jgi:DNA-binding NtrC family response regulator